MGDRARIIQSHKSIEDMTFGHTGVHRMMFPLLKISPQLILIAIIEDGAEWPQKERV